VTFTRIRNGVTLLGLALAIGACNSTDKQNLASSVVTPPNTKVTSVIPVGLWGTDDAELVVTNDGSGLWTFDCGTGATSVPIVPDMDGNFDTAGTYTAFPDIDPNNPDPNPQAISVIYHGMLANDSMTINSIEFDPNAVLPPGANQGGFVITFGTQPTLNDCNP
jgi:hypothetical protein